MKYIVWNLVIESSSGFLGILSTYLQPKKILILPPLPKMSKLQTLPAHKVKTFYSKTFFPGNFIYLTFTFTLQQENVQLLKKHESIRKDYEGFHGFH